MAVEKCNTIPIEIIRGNVGTWTEYIGSKEQLIEAAFADESYFPEGKKRIKYSPGQLGWVIKKIKAGRFMLRKYHEYGAPPKSKDEMYSSPALFKDRVMYTLNSYLGVTMRDLSGKYEFSEWGETTIWIEEQSMQDVLAAGARLVEAIRTAKVTCRRKEPHLSIVK
jgi:hypothetical protein